MVWDWRVSRAEPMLSCWHDLLFLFCLLLFYLFLPSMGWLCGVGVFGLIECSHSLPALHSGLQNNNNNNNKYHVPNDLWLLFFMSVYSRYKYWVHNVWHIIYDYRSSYFWLTEITTVSLMSTDDLWSSFFILCFTEINTVSLMFNIPSMIFVLHLCLFQTKIPCKCSTYHLWSSFFIFLSYRDTVSLMFDRWSMIIVLYFMFYRYEYRVLNVR